MRVSKLTIIGWHNGLAPGRHQSVIWTNAGILLTGPLGTNCSEILIEIQIFSLKKLHLPSGKWLPFCLVNRYWIKRYIANIINFGSIIHFGVGSEVYRVNITENRKLSWYKLCRHWRHRKVSLSKPAVSPVTKLTRLTSWRLSCPSLDSNVNHWCTTRPSTCRSMA